MNLEVISFEGLEVGYISKHDLLRKQVEYQKQAQPSCLLFSKSAK